METVVLRKFNPSRDSGLIYDSFPKGVYYSSYLPIKTDKTKWFKDFFIYTKQLLATPDAITVACMSDNSDVIIGYSIVVDKALEFVYVKESFRNQGIAKLLLKNQQVELYKNVTKVGNAILTKKEGTDHGTT
jgi:GNAT superfamily N-acetyltransferase